MTEITMNLDTKREQLVVTAAKELFDFASIGTSELILPVCSGDMLFNVFDEYLEFLG